MVENFLSAIATLFNTLTYLASYLHKIIAKHDAVYYRLIRLAPQCHAMHSPSYYSNKVVLLYNKVAF